MENDLHPRAEVSRRLIGRKEVNRKDLPRATIEAIKAKMRPSGELRGKFVLLPDGTLVVGRRGAEAFHRKNARWETGLTIRHDDDPWVSYQLVVFADRVPTEYPFSTEQEETFCALCMFLNGEYAKRTGVEREYGYYVKTSGEAA